MGADPQRPHGAVIIEQVGKFLEPRGVLSLDPPRQCHAQLLGHLPGFLMTGEAVSGNHHRPQVPQVDFAGLLEGRSSAVLPLGKANVGAELLGHIEDGARLHRWVSGLGGGDPLGLQGLPDEGNAAAHHEFSEWTLLGGQLVEERPTVGTLGAETLGPGTARGWGTLGTLPAPALVCASTATARPLAPVVAAATPAVVPPCVAAVVAPPVGASTTPATRAVIVPGAAGHQGRGDPSGVVGGPEEFNAFRLLALTLLGCQHRHHLGAVETGFHLGAHHVTRGHPIGEECTVEDTLGLACTSGAPRPRAVVPLAGEFHVDPVRHRERTLPGHGRSGETLPDPLPGRLPHYQGHSSDHGRHQDNPQLPAAQEELAGLVGAEGPHQRGRGR